MPSSVYKTFLLYSILWLSLGSPIAWAEDTVGVVVTVNDLPITNVDITQRLKLMEILNENPGDKGDSRKAALKLLINENIIISEAKKVKANPSEKEIEAQLNHMAEGMKTTEAGLKEQLRKQNISVKLLEQYVASQISFSRYMASKPEVSTKVTKQDVERKFEEIKQDLDRRVNEAMRDPRMQPMEVYSIMEIEFPVETPNDNMLVQARAAEAIQFLQKFKGCSNAKAAASGIYNVKISKPVDAPADRLPPELKNALKKTGVGKAVGPIKGPASLQVIAFCGQRKIQPERPKVEMPTMDQVENLLKNEKMSGIEEGYMAELRSRAFIDYKDPNMNVD